MKKVICIGALLILVSLAAWANMPMPPLPSCEEICAKAKECKTDCLAKDCLAACKNVKTMALKQCLWQADCVKFNDCVCSALKKEEEKKKQEEEKNKTPDQPNKPNEAPLNH